MKADLPTNLAMGLNLETGVEEPTCFRVLYNKLTFLTVFQVCSGMGTAAFAAAFAYGNAGAFPSCDDPQWRTVVQQRIKALQRSVYALSAVLVSSTLTISLFAHLPTGLLKDDSGHASAVSNFAVGVTTFWGALFSLTLVATFAAPAFRILQQVYSYRAASNGTAASTSDLRDWLHEHVFVSVKNQLVNVLSLLAPLLVGPVSSLSPASAKHDISVSEGHRSSCLPAFRFRQDQGYRSYRLLRRPRQAVRSYSSTVSLIRSVVPFDRSVSRI